MSRRKPWEEPIQYNEDRFFEGRPNHMDRDDVREPPSRPPGDNGEERDERDIEELLSRPDEKQEREYECNDTTPINYANGPHDEEFGVEDRFDTPDPDDINYERGPHEDEFGVEDDDDEFEPLDDDDEEN